MSEQPVQEKTIRVPPPPRPPLPPAMPVMDHSRIVRELRTQHDGFMSRYSLFVERSMEERNAARIQTYARIKYVADAFLEANVIQGYQDIDILRYPNSIVMTPKVGDFPVYLVNDCGSIVVAAGQAVGQDPLTARMVIADHGTKDGFFHRAKNVLNDKYDWMAFCSFVLQEMHESVYSREEAIRNIFDQHFENPIA